MVPTFLVRGASGRDSDDVPTGISGAVLYLSHLAPPTPTTSPRRATARPCFASCACQRSLRTFIFVSSEQDNEDGPTGSSGDNLPVASSPDRRPPAPRPATARLYTAWLYPPPFVTWRWDEDPELLAAYRVIWRMCPGRSRSASPSGHALCVATCLAGIQQLVNQLYTVLLASTSHLEFSHHGHLNDVAPCTARRHRSEAVQGG